MLFKTRSFRFRLALFSALVSGVILVAFGIAAWIYVYKNLLQSVDSRLRGPADRMVRRIHEGSDWERAREATRPFDRSFEDDRVMVVMSNVNGTRLFASEQSERASWMDDEDALKKYLPSAEKIADAPRPRQRPPESLRPSRGNDSNSVETGTRPGPGSSRTPGRGDGRGDGRGEGRGDRSQSDRDRPRFPGGRGGGPFVPLGPPQFLSLTGSDGTRWRVVAASNVSATLFIGVNLAAFDTEVRQLRRYFLIALPLGLMAIAGGAWAISRRAMRPLDRIISTASGMSAAELDRRIPVTGNESQEFSKLVGVLNAMMDRLEASFHQASRFTADASHELKTPIAIMQAEIESALKNCPPDSPEAASLINLQGENQQLKRITQSLLLLSQADSGKLKLTEEDVDLSSELAALAEDAEHLCGKEGLSFSSEIAPGIKVRADRVLLMQAVQNLLSNAIKYNAESGEVSCSLSEDAGEAVVTFFNTGEPIPADEQGKIFDRFYRVDKARGPAGVEGFGLGLNLSLEIVRAHGGTLRLAESGEHGTRMELRLAKV